MQSSTPIEKPRKSLADIALVLLAIAYFALLGAVISYIWLFTQDRFISEASFKISRQNPTTSDMGFAALALPGLTDSGSVDSQLAIGFVNSADLLLSLEKNFQLHEHYSSPTRDFFFRLPADAPLEERLEFYRKRISAHFDKETGLTMLTVDSYDPQLSKKIAEDLLKQTEGFINKVNQVVADQQLNFVSTEVQRAEKNVKDVSLEILKLQNANNLVSPEETITSNLLALQELRMRRIHSETSLNSLERDSPDSPRINTLRSQMRSLDEQIAMETAKLSGEEKNSLNRVLANFKELELKLAFANKMLAGAVSLFEKHRMEAVSRSRFITIIQHPFLPEDVGEPRRPYATVTISVVGILLFFILRVLAHSIREKA